jgi:hypothetical protein
LLLDRSAGARGSIRVSGQKRLCQLEKASSTRIQGMGKARSWRILTNIDVFENGKEVVWEENEFEKVGNSQRLA